MIKYMEKIKIVGIEEVKNDEEKEVIGKLSSEYYEKIKRGLNNDFDLVVHLKTYNKGGKQKEWEIKAKIEGISSGFKATESDWDLARTLHKVFQDLQRQIERRFKG